MKRREVQSRVYKAKGNLKNITYGRYIQKISALRYTPHKNQWPITSLKYHAFHNVKSDLIWRKYSPWWLYKAIAIKWGDLGRAGNFGRCLLGTYWGTPDGWHTLTQTNTNTFQYWALLAVKWWPLLPKYGHKSNKINGIELFSLQSLYIYSQEPKKALNLPKFWPPIFPANRAKFYIVY